MILIIEPQADRLAGIAVNGEEEIAVFAACLSAAITAHESPYLAVLYGGKTITEGCYHAHVIHESVAVTRREGMTDMGGTETHGFVLLIFLLIFLFLCFFSGIVSITFRLEFQCGIAIF